MDNKEFLNYEQCEALEGLNYDGDYDFTYHVTGELWERGKKDKKERFLPAPLKQQLFRWFREKYGIQAYLTNYLEMCGNNDGTYHVVVRDSWWAHLDRKDYYEAENNAIDKLIEIIKKQDNDNRN